MTRAAVMRSPLATSFGAGSSGSFRPRELARATRKDDPRERAAARKVWVQRTRRCRAHKRQRLEDD